MVSVCIPAHNCGQYISDTLQCLAVQTYKNIEIVVVDDGSTDPTKQIVKDFPADNICLFCQESKGAAAARNEAYRKCTGDYIKFMDSDDLINPDMIESQVKLALENEGGIISAKWGRFYNNDINTIKLNPEECWQTLPPAEWLCSSWKNGTSMTQAGLFLIPRTTIEKAGLWDEELTLIDDLDFFARAILKSKSMVFDPNSTLYYRSGNHNSLSNHKTKTAIISAFRSIDQATENLLLANPGPKALEACANVWQRLIYDLYPEYPELVKAAQHKVTKFGGSSLKFVSGGKSAIIAGVFGWKTVKLLKHLPRKFQLA